MILLTFFLLIAAAWAVIATVAAVEAGQRAGRAEDFAEECLADLKAARRG